MVFNGTCTGTTVSGVGPERTVELLLPELPEPRVTFVIGGRQKREVIGEFCRQTKV